jgi:hypothetical protein
VLAEIKKHKHFWIALALVLLVPFAVYWFTAGYDVAIRNLAAALALLLTALIYRPITVKRQHAPNQANLEANNSFPTNTGNFPATIIRRSGNSFMDSGGFVKHEQTAMDRIKSLLLGENYTP